MSSSIAKHLSIPATYMRGGTSKAVFFHERDLPPAGRLRDQFMIRMMGAPDAAEIDGMGGGKVVTSKAAIIRPSTRPDADVDYTFVQVGLGAATVAYNANCGNISSAVGPFAINEGLVSSENWVDGRRIVRIWNTGMGIMLIARVPINPSTGRALEKGDLHISGISTPGAPILMEYSETAKPEFLLPTSHSQDRIACSFGEVDISYCSVANPIVFIEAKAMGIVGNETPSELDANTTLLAQVREVRGRVAQMVGICQHWDKVDEESVMIPMVALISPPTSDKATIQSRLFLNNYCHPSMAGTAAICTAAASQIPGSLPFSIKKAREGEQGFVIQHPAGIFEVSLRVARKTGSEDLPSFEMLGFRRTARYIMQGSLFVPEDMHDTWLADSTSRTTNSDEGAKNIKTKP